jgi:hypothetical protein
MSAISPASLFGASLRLVDGDLSLQPEAGAGPNPSGNLPLDLALVSGIDNFSQGLLVLVGTPFGSDPVNVKYGLDVASIFTVANSVASIKDVIRLNLVKSLQGDDRVREILAVVFDDEPDFATYAPELVGGDPATRARRSRAWNAVVAFTTIAGDQQTISLSGASP